MSGLTRAVIGWGLMMSVMPLTNTTGMFEVQLTSLINGWGLTLDGRCCSRANPIRSAVDDEDKERRSRAVGDNDNRDIPRDAEYAHQSSTHSFREEEENPEEEEEEEADGEEEEEEEEEWACEEECRTFLRVCLSHLQQSFPVRFNPSASSCTFGSAVSPVLGGNTLDPFGTLEETLDGRNEIDPATIIKIPFTFTWPESYTLIVEAWHDDHGNRSVLEPSNIIVSAVQQGRIEPSRRWHNYNISTRDTDLSFRYRVVCDGNYYGPGCDVLCRESNNSITGHYGCSTNGSRICLQGWEGESCDKPQCSEECLKGNGSCDRPFECRCDPGWRGVDCLQCRTYPKCLHGYCKKPWQCICHQGWSGSLCNIDNYYCQRYDPCKNGGTCMYDAVNNYTCTCARGFSGLDCREIVCYDGYCVNHGLCGMVEGKRTCRCRRGFEGPRCQHAEVTCGSLVCRNNGTCVRDGQNYRCLCRPGFVGTWCENEIDECLSSPCMNGGVCRDRVNGYHCECPKDHAGRNCDLALNPCLGFRCFNHGTCITIGAGFTPSCLCRPEFTGQRCEVPLDPCVGIYCMHDGTCLRTGSIDFQCACVNGYTGSVCQIPPPSIVCRNQSCLHGGTCRRTYEGAVICACTPGYAGALCERRIVTTTVAEDDGGGGRERGGERGGVRERDAELPRNYRVPNSSVSLKDVSCLLACVSSATATFVYIFQMLHMT